MASAVTNVRLSTTLAVTPAAARGEVAAGRITFPVAKATVYRSGAVACRATPPDISESIKQAEETCSEDSASGECAAAWDEVEELSAAASHARDKAKDADPLETYCKDNPETDECRTYDS